MCLLQAGVLSNRINGSCSFLTLEGTVGLSCIACERKGEFDYLQNTATSLWNFVVNSRLSKIRQRHVERRKCYKLSSIDDRCQFITCTEPHHCIQHYRRDTISLIYRNMPKIPLNIGPSYASKNVASREHWRSMRTRLCSRRVCLVERERIYQYKFALSLIRRLPT